MDEIPGNNSKQGLAIKVYSDSKVGRKKGIFIAGALIMVVACGVFGILVGGYQIISHLDLGKLITLILPAPKPLPNPQLHPGLMIYSTAFDYRGVWEVGRTDDKMMTWDESVINGKYLWDTLAKDGVTYYSIPVETIDIPFQ